MYLQCYNSLILRQDTLALSVQCIYNTMTNTAETKARFQGRKIALSIKSPAKVWDTIMSDRTIGAAYLAVALAEADRVMKGQGR